MEKGDTLWIVSQERIEKANKIFLERDQLKEKTEVLNKLIVEKNNNIVILRQSLATEEEDNILLREIIGNKDKIIEEWEVKYKQVKRKLFWANVKTGIAVGFGILVLIFS